MAQPYLSRVGSTRSLADDGAYIAGIEQVIEPVAHRRPVVHLRRRIGQVHQHRLRAIGRYLGALDRWQHRFESGDRQDVEEARADVVE